METLIDNRDFPTEMQEQPQVSEPKKTNWLGILLILVALGIIGFLVYKIFFVKPLATTNSQNTELGIRRAKVKIAQERGPQITPREREDIINSLFNN
ncbi:MAG: hypothetical protein ACPGTS_00370 [Minisyncoccia bacterium]